MPFSLAIAVAVFVVSAATSITHAGADAPAMAGVWILNRAASPALPRSSRKIGPCARRSSFATACEDHLRISQLPLGAAALVRKDLHRHHFAIAFGHDGPP